MEKFSLQSEISTAPEGFAELSHIVQRMEEISASKDISIEEAISESKVLVKELLDHVHSDLHWQLSNNVTSFYNDMSKENLLARVESITKVIDCLTLDKVIPVGSEDDHYANSVTAEAEGLRIAMAEAEALGPIRFLVGLDVKALVGFKNDHLSVAEIQDDEFDIRDTTLRKAQCRHVSGEIRHEDIKYVVMRIPRNIFPRENLAPDEIKQGGNFVFRGVKIPPADEARTAEQLDIAA